MKKRCLFTMVAALLFSGAGFAQLEIDLLQREMTSNWDGGINTLQKLEDGSYEITYGAAWSAMGWEFDEDELWGGYNLFEIEFTASNGIRIIVKYSDGTQQSHQFLCSDNSPFKKFIDPSLSVKEIAVGNGWCPEGNLAAGDVVTITKAKLLHETFVENFPLDAYIDFEDFLLGTEVPAMSGYAHPIAHQSANGWPEFANNTIENDPEQGLCLRVFSHGEEATFFHVRMSENKTFGDVKKIQFKLKFEQDGDLVDVEKEVRIAINTYYAEMMGDHISQFNTYPAVFYSYPLESIGKYGGGWRAYEMKTAWFENKDFNARLNLGDGYLPDLASLEDKDNIQFGIGLGDVWTPYYIDDIEFLFDDDETSVEVAAVASPVKIYSIDGGIAIDGIESATIYGIDGSIIATAKGKVTLPKGVYIVKAGNRVVKAIVK